MALLGMSLVTTLCADAQSLTADQLHRLHQALQRYHEQYDPAEKLLRVPFSSPGYHTTLKGGTVHPTRTSLQYAVALLDTGDEKLRARAIDILRRVIALQDQDPQSKTYGIWSWFLEEPLDKMSPPDWNWADFCGVLLLQVARDHSDRLPANLREALNAAVRHAARSIQRRNVGPGYTNIALMGTYVTLVTAEMFGLDDLRQYALARLRRFHEYTKQQGAFTEYNSPTYTVVALKELGRMRLHVQVKEARRLLEEIYRMAWEEIAQHFHPPTRQWAGPHSRCYSTLLGKETLSLVNRATEGRVNWGVDEPSLDELRLPLPCPRDLERFFTELIKPREVVKTFLKGDPPVVGTTHLDPEFALGSVNRGDLWNQRRPLLAYWGTAKEPSYFRVRLLHDGYDFAAAQFFSVQRGGDVLAGINFATDGGDTHVSLDRLKDATVQAKDLRLRFEFGGAASTAKLTAPAALKEPLSLRFGEVRVQVAVQYAAWSQEASQWETPRGKEFAALDLVLYHGDVKAIRLADLEEAAVGFALRLTTLDAAFPQGTTRVANEKLTMNWSGLSLRLPLRPAKAATLQKSLSASPVP